MEYLHYSFRSEALCLGERIKKGTFRPTVFTIPYSQITGALRADFGPDVHAVGHITSYENKGNLIYSPRDRITGVSKLPISAEFLVNVKGNIYVLKNELTNNLPAGIEIMLGAFKGKGLGSTSLNMVGLIKVDGKSTLESGELNTRIPVEHLDKFMVDPIKPRYGYLPRPMSLSEVTFVLSLFEGSEVYAPDFLLRQRGEEIGRSG